MLAGKRLPIPPVSVNYLKAMPNNLGMFLNDTLGDCTCAAVYHSLQVWTFMTNTMQIYSNANVLATYEALCGYNPSDPSTDQGGVEQNVLKGWLTGGVPIGPSGDRDVLSAWIEVDPRNINDVKWVINSCGVAYIGFNVPSNIMPDNAPPPQVWDVAPNATILGGHAVALAGYDSSVVNLISWGQKYEMTWPFFQQYTDEIYALVNANWLTYTASTPLGFTLDQLALQMSALKMVA